MYQYCCTNWRWVAQSRTDHPDINPWHLRAPVTLVYNITFITLSSKKPWDPFMYGKEPNLAVRGMHPGHSNVISTSLIHSRSLITPATTNPPCLKKKKKRKKKIPGTWGWCLESQRKYPYFPSSIPGRRNSDDLLTRIFAHFGNPHHHINSEKEIKAYIHWLRPDLPHELVLCERCWNLLAILRNLSCSCLSLPLSCLSSAFELSEPLPGLLVLYILPPSEWKEFADSYFGMSKDGKGNVKGLNEQHEQLTFTPVRWRVPVWQAS